MHPTGKPLTRQIDLNLLELFDTVYRVGNLTVAGQRLGLTQSAVSHGLNKLRAAYGDALFVRTQRGVQPTPFSDTLAESVASVLEQIRGTLAKPVFEPRQADQIFRLAMTDVGERLFLPLLIRWLAREAPKVRLETVSPEVQDLYEGLGAGDIDLAIGFIPGLGKQVRQQWLFHEQFVYLMREGHPHYASTLTPEQVQQIGHAIASPPGTDHAWALDKGLAESGLDIQVALRVRSFLGLAPIVAHTDLVALVPSNLARTLSKRLKVRVSTPPMPLPGFDVCVYWHQRYHQDPANIWLRAGVTRLFEAADRFSGLADSPD